MRTRRAGALVLRLTTAWLAVAALLVPVASADGRVPGPASPTSTTRPTVVSTPPVDRPRTGAPARPTTPAAGSATTAAVPSDPIEIGTFGPFSHTVDCVWRHVVDFPIPAGATYATMTIQTGSANNNQGLDWGVGTDKGWWVNGPGMPLAWNSSATRTYNFPAGSTRLGVDDKVWWGSCPWGEFGNATYSGTFWAPSGPIATLNPLPASDVNPVTLSWSGSGGTEGIATYTLMYQIDDGPTDVLADVPGSVTSLGLWLGDNTQYRFAVQATDRAGNVGDLSAWLSTRTALRAMPALGPDEHPDLFDSRGGGVLCIPRADQRQLIFDLLLAREFCDAMPAESEWRQVPPPLNGWVCPGLQQPLYAPIAGLALLSMRHAGCAGGPGIVTASNGGPEAIREQMRAAHTKIEAAVLGSPFATAIMAGVNQIEQLIERALRAGNYPRAYAYLRQLQRTANYAAEMPRPDWIRAVEVQVDTGRVPDAIVRIRNAAGADITIAYEVKLWPLKLLSNTQAVNKLVEQLNGFLRARTYQGGGTEQIDGVVVEFVQTSEDAITDVNQIIEVLSGRGLDFSRLDIRLVGVMDRGPSTFTPLGG